MPSTSPVWPAGVGVESSAISGILSGYSAKTPPPATISMIIKVRENEPFEVAMRRFKRSIEKPAS